MKTDMKLINRILLCTHPKIMDLDIIDYAADIAKRHQAKVKVFHVIGGFPEDMREWWNVRNPQQLHDGIQLERQDFVDGIAERLRERGVENVTAEIRWGKEFLEITKEVIRNQQDLVMLTARDRTQIGKRLLECPSRDLFLNCPCPLWITKYGKINRKTNRILAALAGSGGKVEMSCDGLNAKILKYAATVAVADASELHVVHALPVYGRKGVKKHGRIPADLLNYLDELRGRIEAECCTLVKEFDVELKEKNIHIVTGKPSIVIPEFIDAMRVDLIVMGTVARAGIPGLVYGNTAEKVLQQVDCGILAIKPDDFVSVVQEQEKGMKTA